MKIPWVVLIAKMTRRVAVIAVHGVGHHQPHEAARATAADPLELVEALKEAYLKGFGRLLRSAGHFRP